MLTEQKFSVKKEVATVSMLYITSALFYYDDGNAYNFIKDDDIVLLA